jgi:hypothetical protein
MNTIQPPLLFPWLYRNRVWAQHIAGASELRADVAGLARIQHLLRLVGKRDHQGHQKPAKDDGAYRDHDGERGQPEVGRGKHEGKSGIFAMGDGPLEGLDAPGGIQQSV